MITHTCADCEACKRFYLESFGKVNLNHPLWTECLELAEVKALKVGDRGQFKFNKGGTIKFIYVRRAE